MDLLFLTMDRFEKTKRCFQTLEHTLTRRPDVKVIIWDNGSKDPTVLSYLQQYAARFSKQVKIHYSSTNLGVAGGREKLWQLATSSLVAFMDSDVIFPNGPGWLDRLINAMLKQEIGFCGPAGAFIKDDWSWVKEPPKGYTGAIELVTGYCLVTRLKFRDEGVHFDQAYNPYWYEDGDLCMQIAALGYRGEMLGNIGIKHMWGKQGATPADGFRKAAYFKSKWQGKGIARFERKPPC